MCVAVLAASRAAVPAYRDRETNRLQILADCLVWMTFLLSLLFRVLPGYTELQFEPFAAKIYGIIFQI